MCEQIAWSYLLSEHFQYFCFAKNNVLREISLSTQNLQLKLKVPHWFLYRKQTFSWSITKFIGKYVHVSERNPCNIGKNKCNEAKGSRSLPTSSFSFSHCRPEQPKIQTAVLGHSLVRSLVCSHRSLVCSLRTARFASALRCAYSFARSLTSLTPSLVGQWIFDVSKLPGFVP